MLSGFRLCLVAALLALALPAATAAPWPAKGFPNPGGAGIEFINGAFVGLLDEYRPHIVMNLATSYDGAGVINTRAAPDGTIAQDYYVIESYACTSNTTFNAITVKRDPVTGKQVRTCAAVGANGTHFAVAASMGGTECPDSPYATSADEAQVFRLVEDVIPKPASTVCKNVSAPFPPTLNDEDLPPLPSAALTTALPKVEEFGTKGGPPHRPRHLVG